MADEKNLTGQSFRNEALTGSGTILPDGTMGDPLPDPTEVRGLGPDKTSGGRNLAITRDPIPDALIVSAPEPETTSTTTSRTAAKK